MLIRPSTSYEAAAASFRPPKGLTHIYIYIAYMYVKHTRNREWDSDA